MSGVDKLIEEIGTIAKRHMRKQKFSARGSLYQITVKKKVKFYNAVA